MEEQQAILMTQVDNSNSQGYSANRTIGGNDTEDRIFILSYAEAWKYFGDDEIRKCAPTEYTIGRSGYEDDPESRFWWLRSPGFNMNSATTVNPDGCRHDLFVDFNFVSVRPVLWINLEADIFLGS